MESFIKVGRFPATAPLLANPSPAITQSDDPQSGSNSNKKRNLTSARNVVDAIAPAPLTLESAPPPLLLIIIAAACAE